MIFCPKGEPMNFFKYLILLAALYGVAVEAKTLLLTKTNTVAIRSQIDDESVTKAAYDLAKKCVKDANKKDLYLVLYSPGGSVGSGMEFIEFVKSLPCKVHTISMYAASMAYTIAQSLDKRYVLESSYLMSHRASISLSGEIPGEFLVLSAFYKSMLDEIEFKTAQRLGITLKDYQFLIRDELWLTGQQAVKMKHADELVKVRCSDDLLLSNNVMIQGNMFQTLVVTFSGCPLLTSPIKIEAKEKKDDPINDLFTEIFGDFKIKKQ